MSFITGINLVVHLLYPFTPSLSEIEDKITLSPEAITPLVYRGKGVQVRRLYPFALGDARTPFACASSLPLRGTQRITRGNSPLRLWRRTYPVPLARTPPGYRCTGVTVTVGNRCVLSSISEGEGVTVTVGNRCVLSSISKGEGVREPTFGSGEEVKLPSLRSGNLCVPLYPLPLRLNRR